MKLTNIPFLLINTSLLLGIIIGYYAEINSNFIFLLLFVALIGLGISWFGAKKIYRKPIYFSIITIFFFFSLGIALVSKHDPTNEKEHYVNLLKTDQTNDIESQSIQFIIRERLKPTEFYNKFVVSVSILQGKQAKGKILLLLPKDGFSTLPFVGEKWIGIGKLQPIPKPLNPDQFDYAAYLSKHYIYYRFTPYPNHLKKTGGKEKSIYRFADQARLDIIKKLSNHTFSPKQLSIISALLLGQRQDIDQDTFKDYRDAGAIHILAVSGLHVGVLMFIFNFLLKPLERFRRKGKIIKTIVVILFLWSFAVLAGLSPSVLRAVTMFSFLLVGLQIRSKTSTYNSLLTSLFVLLCFQPMLLFSVGFQLSYLAVFAIIWIQPMLISYYTPRFKLDKILWETFTVTIAAQLGLLPLTLFYFHQFPTLFFIANLLIIPVLGIILGIGVLVIVLAEIEFLPDILVQFFGGSINGMNAIVHWVAMQDRFLISHITFSWRMLILSYILIILFILFLKKKTVQKVIAIGVVFAVFLTILIIERESQYAKEELIIFHNPRNTTLGILQNRTLKLYAADSITKKNRGYILDSYLIKNNAAFVSEKRLKNVYMFQEKTILIVDQSGIYKLDSFQPDILLLSGNPKVHLGSVIKHLKPEQIIVDGSNWKNNVDLWEETCKKQNIPFYKTDISGAFILKK